MGDFDIKKKREKYGLSREELAFHLDVSYSTLYRWETGEIEPHPVFIKEMKQIFDNLEMTK